MLFIRQVKIWKISTMMNFNEIPAIHTETLWTALKLIFHSQDVFAIASN